LAPSNPVQRCSEDKHFTADNNTSFSYNLLLPLTTASSSPTAGPQHPVRPQIHTQRSRSIHSNATTLRPVLTKQCHQRQQSARELYHLVRELVVVLLLVSRRLRGETETPCVPISKSCFPLLDQLLRPAHRRNELLASAQNG
jgi:hypothetical protein